MSDKQGLPIAGEEAKDVQHSEADKGAPEEAEYPSFAKTLVIMGGLYLVMFLVALVCQFNLPLLQDRHLLTTKQDRTIVATVSPYHYALASKITLKPLSTFVASMKGATSRTS